MIKLIYENDNFDKLTMEMSSEILLSELIEKFTLFLKGCGYFISENQYLDFIDFPNKQINKEKE
jgi:hypothetical protein